MIKHSIDVVVYGKEHHLWDKLNESEYKNPKKTTPPRFLCFVGLTLMEPKRLSISFLFLLLFCSVGFTYPQSDAFKDYVKGKANCRNAFGEPWVMVLVANGCYFDVALNLVLDLEYTHNTTCVVLFTDTDGMDILDNDPSIGVDAYNYDSLDFPFDILANYTPKMPREYTPPFPYMVGKYHSRYFVPNTGKFTFPRWPIWMLRHSISLSILELGVGIFQSDVDVAFLSPPDQFIKGDFDVQGQAQRMTRIWEKELPKLDLNLGFGFVRPNTGGVLHWRAANAMMRYRGLDPQTADNILLWESLRGTGVMKQGPEGVVLVSPMVKALWWKSTNFFHPAGLKNDKYSAMSSFLGKKGRWFLKSTYRSHVCG